MKLTFTIILTTICSFAAAWFLQEKKWSLRLENSLSHRSETYTVGQFEPFLEAKKREGYMSATLAITADEDNEFSPRTKSHLLSTLEGIKNEISSDELDGFALRYNLEDSFISRDEMKSFDDFYRLEPSAMMELLDSHLTMLGANQTD